MPKLRTSVLLALVTGPLVLLVGPSPSAIERGPGPARLGQLSLSKHFFRLENGRRVRGQWGELEVPENWNDGRTRRIELSFARFPAKRGDGVVPTFFIAGGPGASAIGSFAGNAKWLLPLRRLGDVVLVEQRGTGFSRPRLDCEQRWDLSVGTPHPREELVAVARERFAACRREWVQAGVDLSCYNTRALARDVVAVADALGYGQFSVVAFSYGTQVALELLRSTPGRVTRMVLLGVMGPADSLRHPSDHDAVLARAQNLLARDPASTIYPDLVASTERAIERLRRDPIELVVPDAEDGAVRAFAYDEMLFRQQLVVRLGIRRELARLPRFVHALAGGTDEEWLRSELRHRLPGILWRRRGPLATRSAAQHYAIVCSGADPAPRDQAPPGSLLGHTFHLPLPEACDAWGVANLGRAFREPPSSDVPVLMFSADLDTKTPKEQAERLLPSLVNARHVVLLNAGHAELLEVNDEVNRRMQSFLAGEAVDTSPIALAPIRFHMPSALADRCRRNACADVRSGVENSSSAGAERLDRSL